MDHTTTTMAAFDQENNQLLLNAIKNKFAAQTDDVASSFSPPKFTIPTLKTLEGASVMAIGGVSNTKQHQDNGPNQLNHFLLKQLQEQQQQPNQDMTKNKGFVEPQLQFPNEITIGSPRFEIPLLKASSSAILSNNSNSAGVSSLTTAINKLQVQENVTTNTSSTNNHTNAIATTTAIDLTYALASKSSHHHGTPPTRDFQGKLKQQQHQQSSKSDFVIPFIDCDRLDNATALRRCTMVLENEYCLTDISQQAFKPSFKKQPSPVGQFLYLVEKRYTPMPLKCITSAQQYKLNVKHDVQPFQFDTKSPDDKVLESLSKYRMR